MNQDNINYNKILHNESEVPSFNYRGIILRRWAATVIDAIILLGMFFMPSALDRFAKGSINNSIITCIVLLSFISIISYYLILEALTGYTVGKFILRIRVIDYKCCPPGFKKGFIRSLLRIFEINPILLGGVIAFIATACSKHHQRIGDKVAETLVVKNKELKNLMMRNSRKRLSIILTIYFVFISICGLGNIAYSFSKNMANTDTYKIIKSTKLNYQLSVSNDWIDTVESISDKQDVDLSIANIDKKISLFGSELRNIKDIRYIGTDLYSSILVSNYIKLINGELLSKIIKEKINGYEAIEFALSGALSNEKGIMNIISIKTKNSVHVFYSWSTVGERENDLKEIKKVINTFTEIPSPVSNHKNSI